MIVEAEPEVFGTPQPKPWNRLEAQLTTRPSASAAVTTTVPPTRSCRRGERSGPHALGQRVEVLCGQQFVGDGGNDTRIADPTEDLNGALDRPHGVVHAGYLVTTAPDVAHEP